MTPGKQRQAEYRARMLAEGKRQYAFWLTDEQVQAIKAYLAGNSSLLTPAQPERAPEPARPRLEPVGTSKPDRITEYLVILNGQQIGRVWQVNEKPRWRGYPRGFNEQQYSGATRQAVIERVVRYQQV